jgi:RNA-binding protein YhbY
VEGPERQALAEQAATAIGADLITVVGRTALLYRANPELDAKQRVLKA